MSPIRNQPGIFEQLLQGSRTISYKEREAGLKFLITLFSEIRPGRNAKNRDPQKNIERVTALLVEHPAVLESTQQAFISQLINTDLTAATTQSGIPMARGFWQEFTNRLKHKLLPPLQEEQDFLYVINHIFFKKDDFKWIAAISRDSWIRFFKTIGFNLAPQYYNIKKELLQSLKFLSYQVAQLGLEKEILGYLPEKNNQQDTPFVQQNYIVHEIEKLVIGNAGEQELKNISLELKKSLQECNELIDHIRQSHSEKGASIHQTYLVFVLSNRMQRMELVIDVLDADHEFDTGRFVDIFRMLVRNEKRKYSIRELFSQGVGYLAYQIAEHKGSKGQGYIVDTSKDYYRMIFSSMKGGLIISVIAVLKNLAGKLKLAPFPQGFIYSMNYSAGFIAIDLSGSTLATKQPAFTASAVAGSLDTKKIGAPDLDNLAVTVAKVSRSQFASFFGNLIIVFPVSFLLAWAYYAVFSQKIAEGEAAFNLLKDQHPWRSLSLLYACFTGFFLFLSGIIAGYWQNKIQYGRIRERLQQHPRLKRTMQAKRLGRLGKWVEKNMGSVVGNIALGFFLGFAGILGHILGIPFDIRHITISAGNTAIGIYGLGINNIPPYFLLAVFGGVAMIGFLNFLVSFSLAFFVAIKSRGVRFYQYPRLFKIIGNYFWKHPREFFLPPRKIKPAVYRPLGGE